MPVTEVKIITHGDVDGMVCAAQLIRREQSQCELIFSNAKYINRALQGREKQAALPAKIYISDIPANARTPGTLKALREKGVWIGWIDHHPWPEAVRARVEEIVDVLVYNASLSTPAGVLLGRWLKEDDPYYDQVGRICYAYEKGTVWERNWFRLLASYIGDSDRAVLERLAYNNDFTDEDLQRINDQEKMEQCSEELLLKAPETVSVHSGGLMAVYDTSTERGLYLGHKVFDHHDVQYCLIRISQGKWQLACNPSLKRSMKALMGHHTEGRENFSVAGRQSELLAIEWNKPVTHADPHGFLINWICERL
jgi:hypothetical protein